MAYRIAIIDDNPTDTEYIRQLLTDWARDRQVSVQPQTFVSAENFLFHYSENKAWDLLLLDIEMGAMDGVSLARRIRAENDAVQILFITGFPDFMAQGYDVAALHYLLKPVMAEKLFPVLDRAVGNLQKTEKHLALSFDRQTALVSLRSVTHLEARKQYVIVRTEREEYRVKKSLSEMEKELDEYFFKCQRSFIVNLRHVSRICPDRVVLKNGTEVPISRGMAQKIGKEIIRLF